MPEYGYNNKLDLIRSEYKFDGMYLDNAAAPLIAKSIALKAAEFIVSNPLLNPHSGSYWALKTSDLISKTRSAFLRLLNTSSTDYDLVFVQNATHGLKLVGECLADRHLQYLIDSHTSVVGMRNLSKSFSAVGSISPEAPLDGAVVCWPLQSNFDGKLYPGQPWVEAVAAKCGISLVDMAAYCSTTMPDFSTFQPDLAVVSFYKIFGLPDLGGLLIRKSEKTRALFEARRYAGGGTLALVTPIQDRMVRNPDLCASLEDGTLPFHSIATLNVAMSEFERLYGGFEAISGHTSALASYCYDQLVQLPFCKLWSARGQGPIVTFTLSTTGYHEFANVCSKLDIHVRTGTLCNVGAFTLGSTIKDDDLVRNYTHRGKMCSDDQDVIDGIDTGVIRVSPGPYSSKRDIDRLVEVICLYFSPTQPQPLPNAPAVATVSSLVIYPIKSCAALHVERSQVTHKGLKWDREFALINPQTGKIYSLKKHHVMNRIHSRLLAEEFLEISFKGDTIKVPLDPAQWPVATAEPLEFCTDRAAAMHINADPTLVAFLTKIIGAPCSLVRIEDQEARHSQNSSASVDTPLSLSNSSPILVISATSARDLEADTGVFRANIIIESASPWVEDTWAQLSVGNGRLSVLGPCRRCNMVCVTPEGTSNPHAYLALTKTRRFHGKLWFGQHAQSLGDLFEVAVGDPVKCTQETSPVYIER